MEILNKHLLITAKPMIYLINLSEKDFIRKKNKWLPKIKEYIDKNELNLGNLRVTDTKFNRRTILPENRNKRIEAQESLRKENTMRAFQNYKFEKNSPFFVFRGKKDRL